LHAVYTLLDLHSPRRLLDGDPSVAHAMANSALRLSGGRTDVWQAWIDFNFSHSLGLLLVAALALWGGFRVKMLPVGIIMPALTLIRCAYEVLALLYWFRFPAIGVAAEEAFRLLQGKHDRQHHTVWSRFETELAKRTAERH
jgi:hypothetical protein